MKNEFNGGYIKASQEAYDLLIEAEYVPNKLEVRNLHTQYLRITNNMIMYVNGEHAKYLELKQFYINNGALSWDEPKYYKPKFVEDESTKYSKVYKIDIPIQINNMEDLNELEILGEETLNIVSEGDTSVHFIDTCKSCGHPLNGCICKTITITDEDGKVCTKCEELKSLDKYGKDKKSPDRKTYWCKDCTIAERRTKNGVLIKIYNTQIRNSKKRGHPEPSYTMQELKDWLFSQNLFHVLYDNWVLSEFEKDLSPPVDRINDSIGYRMSNIQLMSFAENKLKHYRDVVNGHSKGNSKKVSQFCKETGILLKVYQSAHEASRITGIQNSHISAVCNKKRDTAGGFVWTF